MQIWVDADACPVVIKEVLYRAAERTETLVTFVANQSLRVPRSPFLKTLQVASGFDEADNEIVRRVEAGDLVITADIPLAADIIEKGATALTPRGEPYTRQNIRAKLNMRDFMETMRNSGVEMSGGPPPLHARDRQQFANHLDRWLAKNA